MEPETLLEFAKEARTMAYAPYSHFKVGAALLTAAGRVFKGCNIENAAYTPANCAERTAFFKAVSEGEREFTAIAIVGGQEEQEEEKLTFCAPCGVCRQVMMEFCDPKEFQIILGDGKGKIQIYRLEELFPMGFGPDNLKES